jgi:prophage regulatory protein
MHGYGRSTSAIAYIPLRGITMTGIDNGGASPTAAEQMLLGPRPLRLINKAELRKIVPYTPQHILRLEKRGLFPRRVQVGPNRVGWLLTEIEQWIAVRIAERDASATPAVQEGVPRTGSGPPRRPRS